MFIELDDADSIRPSAIGACREEYSTSGETEAHPTANHDPEAEAQQFALDTLLGPSHTQRMGGVRAVSDALDLAEELGVGSALIVSRLQALGIWTYRHGAALKRPVPSVEELLSGRPPVLPRPRPERRARGGADIENRGCDD